MISVVRQPQPFQMAGNPNIFQFTSDNPGIRYFKVDVLAQPSNTVVATDKFDIRPNYMTGCVIDLSNHINNLVRPQINNSNNIVEAFPDNGGPMFCYQLRVTEMGLTGGTMAALGSPYTLPDGYIVWCGEQDRITARQQTWKQYIGGQTSAAAWFLTDKPYNTKVNPYSTEYLYFINDHIVDMKLNIDLIDPTGGELTNAYVSIPNHYPTWSWMYRLNVSPRVIEPLFGYDYSIAAYYEVYITETNTNTQITEKRRFYISDLPCSVEPTNLLWYNSLGGLDSYQFYNVKESINFQKQTIKTSTYKLTNGVYSDVTGKVYNSAEQTYDVSRSGAYTATSGFLTDAESYWLHQLYRSQQVFVETDEGYLMPVTVTGSAYEIQKRKQNRSGYNSITVNFTMPDDFIPLKPTNSKGSAMIPTQDNNMNLL